MAEFMKTGKSTPADAAAQLPNIKCAALVVMGTLDPTSPTPGPRATPLSPPCRPGWARSRWSTGRALPARAVPDEVAARVIPFLKEHAGA